MNATIEQSYRQFRTSGKAKPVAARTQRALSCFLVGALLVWGLLSLRPNLPKASVPNRPRLIAHAGGGINLGIRTYSNSLEALDASYADGHRYLELDFCWTTDGELVALHDWESTAHQWFSHTKGKVSHDEFMSLKMKHGIHQCDLAMIVEWLTTHDDAFIVTDIKDNNLAGLKIIGQVSKRVRSQFIPQIYEIDEYEAVSNMGYQNIILTLYRSPDSNWDIIRFLQRHEVFAVTMPPHRALRWGFANTLHRGGMFVFAHTINSADKFNSLRSAGVSGVYTDWITNAELELRPASKCKGGDETVVATE